VYFAHAPTFTHYLSKSLISDGRCQCTHISGIKVRFMRGIKETAVQLRCRLKSTGMLASLYLVPALLPLVFGNPSNVKRNSNDCKQVCEAISAAISSKSAVFYPGGYSSVLQCPVPHSLISGSKNYENDISHWFSSSSQQSTCTVEPGCAQDVGVIVNPVAVLVECHADGHDHIQLQILGKSRTPFAVSFECVLFNGQEQLNSVV